MRKYFFCDTCLEITGLSVLDDRFTAFSKEQPFRSVITLCIQAGPPIEPVCTAYADSTVKIGPSEDGGWVIKTSDSENLAALKADAGYSDLSLYIGGAAKNPERAKENALELLRIVIECNISHHDKTALHASFVEYEGRAILFTAPSGVGKSTQAALWESRFRASVINGDRPCIGPNPAGAFVHGVPWDGKEKIFKQATFPAAAIIEVRQARENALRRLSKAQAFRLLLKQSFIPAWDDGAKFAVIKTLKSISETVPFYRLFCLPEKSAAELVRTVLFTPDKIKLKECRQDMRIKDGFILKNVVGEWIVMPRGDNIKSFEGAIVLNELAAFIWKRLESPISKEDLLCAILSEYEIDEKSAQNDIDSLLVKIDSLGILEREAV